MSFHLPKFAGPLALTITPWQHGFALISFHICQDIATLSYLRSSLKQDRLCSRTAAEGKGAYSLCSSVVERIEHLIQPLMAQCLQEVFAFGVSVFVVCVLEEELTCTGQGDLSVRETQEQYPPLKPVPRSIDISMTLSAQR